MTTSEERTDPVEALLDLLLYAPLGLITQLDELLPGLIERGRSQAVMARTIGEFAVRAGATKVQGRADDTQKVLEDAARSLLTVVSGLVERGSGSTSTSERTDAGGAVPDAGPPGPTFPIDGYDTRKATEIIPLLDGLDATQRSMVEAHERAGRARKTILNRLTQLAAAE